MRGTFLSTVREGNVETVKGLIKRNATSFYLSYFINKPPKIVSNLDEEMTAEQLAERIKALEAKVPGLSEAIVYTSWAYLDKSELALATMNSALIIAVESGNAPMLELLLSGGFDRAPAILLKGDKHKLKSDLDFMKLFQAPTYQFNYTKADPNTRNEKGESVLQLAVQTKSEACVQLLLKFGSQPQKDDKKTYDFCKSSLSKMLKSCSHKEKIKLKKGLKQSFPDLFPTPTWLVLLRYVRRILSNYIYNPLTRSLGYVLNSLAHALNTLASVPRTTVTTLPPPRPSAEPGRIMHYPASENTIVASTAINGSVNPYTPSLRRSRSQ